MPVFAGADVVAGFAVGVAVAVAPKYSKARSAHGYMKTFTLLP